MRRASRSRLFPYTTLFRSAPPPLAVPPHDRPAPPPAAFLRPAGSDRKSTRLNSRHANLSYALFRLEKNTDGVWLYLWDGQFGERVIEVRDGIALFCGRRVT